MRTRQLKDKILRRMPSKTVLIVAVLLCVFGLLSRLVPHVANFSPVLALAAFSGFYFRRSALAWALPLVMIIISDAFLGFYTIAPIVWFSYVAIALGSRALIRRGSVSESLFAGIAAAVWFFVITNFAVWAEGKMYALTVSGLIECYVAAVPFFRATLLSTVMYSVLIFTLYRMSATQTARRVIAAKQSL